mgnify:CR=1 FL=1
MVRVELFGQFTELNVVHDHLLHYGVVKGWVPENSQNVQGHRLIFWLNTWVCDLEEHLVITQNVFGCLWIEISRQISKNSEGHLLNLGWAIQHFYQVVETGVLIVVFTGVNKIIILFVKPQNLEVDRVFRVHLLRIVKCVFINIFSLNQWSFIVHSVSVKIHRMDSILLSLFWRIFWHWVFSNFRLTDQDICHDYNWVVSFTIVHCFWGIGAKIYGFSESELSFAIRVSLKWIWDFKSIFLDTLQMFLWSSMNLNDRIF